MREWNAGVYHRVSNPQREWGLQVLDRLPLEGDETVLDVGCGTGRLTEKLVERVPRGRVVAVDQSINMLQTAREHLLPRFGRQISFVRAEATTLPFVSAADAVFSTATFHWVLDHERLFARLFTVLRSGGRLVAQCGGGPNIERVHARCRRLMAEPEFAPHFASWRDPWEFAGAETTAHRLARAGFSEIRTDVQPAPVTFPDGAAYREFVEHVICHPHLSYLPDPTLRARWMERITEQAAFDDPPFELDYWRLNLNATKA